MVIQSLPHRCGLLARSRRLDTGNGFRFRLYIPVHIKIGFDRVRQTTRLILWRLGAIMSGQRATILHRCWHVHCARLLHYYGRYTVRVIAVLAITAGIPCLALSHRRAQGTILVLPWIRRRGWPATQTQSERTRPTTPLVRLPNPNVGVSIPLWWPTAF